MLYGKTLQSLCSVVVESGCHTQITASASGRRVLQAHLRVLHQDAIENPAKRLELSLQAVLAVISLLLAILLPALSVASEAGRAAVGSTYLDQLFHGAVAYAQDNGGRLVLGR